MTHRQWFKCAKPQSMIEFIRRRATGRQYWALFVECRRRFRALGFSPERETEDVIVDTVTARSPKEFCDWVRCICGNLIPDPTSESTRMSPATVDFRWRTSAVLDLAGRIDKTQDYDLMAILADALMDAGCDSSAIVSHCQEHLPHVPGCFVIDLCLGEDR